MTLKGFWTLRKMFCSNNKQTESLLFIKHIATSVGVTAKICNGRGAWNSAKLCLLPVTEGNWIFCFRITHIIYEVDITFFLLFPLRFLFMTTSMPSGLTNLIWHPLWTYDLIKTPFILQVPFLCLPRGLCESVWDTGYSIHYVFSSYCWGTLKMESYGFQSLLSCVCIRK